MLTASIAVMTAGDMGVQFEVLYPVFHEVRRRVAEKPAEWLHVADVVEVYRNSFNTVRQRLSEQAILAPLGLKHQSFLANQKTMAPSLVTQIATELLNFSPSTIECLFVGLDPTGSHIYATQNGHTSCHDAAGFGAIGAGYWHADSHLMFAQHSVKKEFPETLLNVYSSKKRAEVAPGVGRGTDMAIIGARLGENAPVTSEVKTEVHKIYKQMVSGEQRALKHGKQAIIQYVDQLIAATAQANEGQAAKESASDPDSPALESQTGSGLAGPAGAGH